jgi:hypothetical protein
MRLLVVGGVAAGTKAAARARREYPDAEITILTQDEYVAYAGCGLPYFVGGEIREAKELIVRTPDEFKHENAIDVLTRHLVTEIQPAAHTVATRDLTTGEERTFAYDKLILATGALPIIPPIPGADLKRVSTVRGLGDAKKDVGDLGFEVGEFGVEDLFGLLELRRASLELFHFLLEFGLLVGRGFFNCPASWPIYLPMAFFSAVSCWRLASALRRLDSISRSASISTATFLRRAASLYFCGFSRRSLRSIMFGPKRQKLRF